MKKIIILVFILFSCHTDKKKNYRVYEQKLEKVDKVILNVSCSELKNKIESHGDIRCYKSFRFRCLNMEEQTKLAKLMIDKYNYEPAAYDYVCLFLGKDFLKYKKLKLKEKKMIINYLNKANTPELIEDKNIILLLLCELDNVNNYNLDSIKNRLIMLDSVDGLKGYKMIKDFYIYSPAGASKTNPPR